jgi:hypothetical protein
MEPICSRRYAYGEGSCKDDVKEPQAKHQPTKVVLPQFEEWHPSHIKTGLRNRRIAKKVPVPVREDLEPLP